jgi:HpcH/HpaI aldolase/citrate lyase family
MEAFVERSNEETLVCVQLEHRPAIRNVHEILAVEGVVDVFFVGPSDLSQSMGFPGNPKADPVKAAIEDTLRKIIAAGQIPGTPAATETVAAVLGSGAKPAGSPALPLHSRLHARGRITRYRAHLAREDDL